MAAHRYQPRRTPAELDVDAAIQRAEDRVRVPEQRLQALDDRIEATRRMAAAAHIFDPRIPFTRAPARERGAAPKTARAAVARALPH